MEGSCECGRRSGVRLTPWRSPQRLAHRCRRSASGAGIRWSGLFGPPAHVLSEGLHLLNCLIGNLCSGNWITLWTRQKNEKVMRGQGNATHGGPNVGSLANRRRGCDSSFAETERVDTKSLLVRRFLQQLLRRLQQVVSR